MRLLILGPAPVGLGPRAPDLMELPDEVVTAACEGILEVAEMLELGTTLSLIDIQLDDDATLRENEILMPVDDA